MQVACKICAILWCAIKIKYRYPTNEGMPPWYMDKVDLSVSSDMLQYNALIPLLSPRTVQPTPLSTNSPRGLAVVCQIGGGKESANRLVHWAHLGTWLQVLQYVAWMECNEIRDVMVWCATPRIPLALHPGYDLANTGETVVPFLHGAMYR